MTKTCYKCKIEKNRDQFGTDKRMDDGLNYYCKPCLSKRKPKDTDDFRGSITKECPCCLSIKSGFEFYLNKDRKGFLSKTCKDCIKNNIQPFHGPQRKEPKKKKERIKKITPPKPRKAKKKRQSRKHKDLSLKQKIMHKIRRSIRGMMKSFSNLHSFRTSCTGQQLKFYLESQFKPGMTWDNKGVVWELDHIIPLAAFNVLARQQDVYANHYLNLRPAFKKDNVEKGYLYNPTDKLNLLFRIEALNL